MALVQPVQEPVLDTPWLDTPLLDFPCKNLPAALKTVPFTVSEKAPDKTLQWPMMMTQLIMTRVSFMVNRSENFWEF